MTMARADRNRSQGGFTLVEMLVTLVLLSLLMLGLAGAMGTMGRTEDSIDNRLQRMDEARSSEDFLRAVLSRISAKKVRALQQAGSAPYFFSGEPQAMTWVGVMPARYGAGGRYHFRLAMGQYLGAPAVMLSYTPWVDAQTLPNWGGAESYPILTHATRLAFQYQNGNTDPPVWGAAWGAADALPQAVQVVMASEQDVLPPVVAQLRILPVGDPLGNELRISVGGGGEGS